MAAYEYQIIYDSLIGKEIKVTIDGEDQIIKVTEQMIKCSEKKLAEQRRKVLLRENNIDAKQTPEYIVMYHIRPEEVLNNVPAILSLIKQHKENTAEVRDSKQKEVKFDDVRNMDLSLENWETYTPKEREFAQGLLNAYNDYYDLNAPNDKTGIYDVIDLEVRMQTIRLYIRLSKKKDEIAEYDNKLKELRVQWSKALDDLALKKKQRDVAKPKPTDTSNDLTNAIKSLDDMQAEAAQRKLEIQKKKLNKNRNKD